MTVAALNRALLARQGLLERLDAPLVEAVEAVGALQAQYWPAPPAALWSRVAGFDAEALYAALEEGELVTGTLLRATLHLVSAREHPAYAAVAAEAARPSLAPHGRRAGREGRHAAHEAAGLRAPRRRARARRSAPSSRSGSPTHPDALDAGELERQRELKWRPFQRWSAFVRAPADGAWGTKAPSALRAAPRPRGAPKGDNALDEVVRRHLRAFGPAGADDVAGWIGWRTPPVREALERLDPTWRASRTRTAARSTTCPTRRGPTPRRPRRPRLLAAFDSVLLAYAAKRRDAHPARRAPRRRLRAAQPADPPELPRRRAGGGDVVDRGQAARGDRSRCARSSASRARRARALVDEAERLAQALQPRGQGARGRRRALKLVKHRPAKGVESARAADRIPRAPRRLVRRPGAARRAQADARHRQPVRDDGLRSAEEPRRLRAAGPLRGRRDGHRGARPRDHPLPRGRRRRATTWSSPSAATAPSTRRPTAWRTPPRR